MGLWLANHFGGDRSRRACGHPRETRSTPELGRPLREPVPRYRIVVRADAILTDQDLKRVPWPETTRQRILDPVRQERKDIHTTQVRRVHRHVEAVGYDPRVEASGETDSGRS